jgi:hypothetical protein
MNRWQTADSLGPLSPNAKAAEVSLQDLQAEQKGW